MLQTYCHSISCNKRSLNHLRKIVRKTFQLTSHAWCGQSLVPCTRFNIRSTMLHNFLAQDGQKLKFVIVSKRECIGKEIVAHLMRINDWKVIYLNVSDLFIIFYHFMHSVEVTECIKVYQSCYNLSRAWR